MKVLILGAGAIGTVLGHILTKKKNGGNSVTFLVRGSKVESMQGKAIPLYSYDSKKLIQFSEFDVLATESLTRVNPEWKDYELCILTLHTDILKSEDGKKLLKSLRVALNDNCAFMSISPGFGVQEACFDGARIDPSNVGFGLPLFLCHEVGIHGQPEDAKFSARAEAKFAFHYLVSSWFPMMIGKNPGKKVTKALKGGGGRAFNYGNNVLEASTVMFLILNLMLNLQNYPDSLDKSDPKFGTAMAAFGQIMKNYGFVGGSMKLFMGKNMFRITDSVNRRMTKPLTMDFIKYHHGGKVVEQNLGVIKAYVDSGKQMDKPVDKIEEFVALFDKTA